ncbi:MAG: metal-sulfur cluster assembly factor [Anaerolineales bacterium]|nr:metal-sulfur cluster assembly factor [Chloroflexota bacterium]MBL6982020.1 metal-sulfur cluster assembly factor [Anaerolineales bacterium]
MDEERVRDALRFVTDPEVGVNIVDLGLVYDVAVNSDTVDIKMTMTSPTCPLHAVITRNAENTIRAKFHAARYVNVELVWDPIWTPTMMSQKAKQTLGW